MFTYLYVHGNMFYSDEISTVSIVRFIAKLLFFSFVGLLHLGIKFKNAISSCEMEQQPLTTVM